VFYYNLKNATFKGFAAVPQISVVSSIVVTDQIRLQNPNLDQNKNQNSSPLDYQLSPTPPPAEALPVPNFVRPGETT
jgi:hypothetical protein